MTPADAHILVMDVHSVFQAVAHHWKLALFVLVTLWVVK